MKNVYIHGVGTTAFGEHSDADALDLAVQAAELALQDAGKTMEDIEAMYVGNMLAGVLDGQQHFGAHLAERFGSTVPIYTTEAACASGGMALNLAWQQVRGGGAKTVLVLGTESMTKAGSMRVNDALKHAASNAERTMGIGFAGLYGLMASAYLHHYNLPEEVLWWGPALIHRQACGNPKAQYKKAFTPEQVGKSRVISSPLRLLECSPHTDGAAALVLSASPHQVQLVGSEIQNSAPGLAERDNLISIPAVASAWQKMKTNQGITANDIDVVELHDCFSIGGVLALEDLELAARGAGGMVYKDIYEGKKTPSFAVNPSGGLKACGHPVGATGVKQVVSVVEYFRANADAKCGLTHNVGGTGGTAALHYLVQS